MKKNMQKRLTLIVFALVFTLAAVGAVSAADDTAPQDNLGTDVGQGANNFTTNDSQNLPDPYVVETGESFFGPNAIQRAIDDTDTLNGYHILIQPGTYNEHITISKSLTLTGTGASPSDTIINGTNNGRVFTISPGVIVILENMLILNGHAPDGTTGNPGTNGANGGAILNQGTLTLNNVAITNSQAGNGGNGATGTSSSNNGKNGGNGGSGGAIYNTGTLTLNSCTLSGNNAGNGGNGGNARQVWGVYVSDGGSGGNAGSGGAIYNTGTLTLNSCTVSSNNAGRGGNGGNGLAGGNGGNAGSGGAIYSTGTLTINSIVMYNNNANTGGSSGTLFGSSGADGSGGAIYNSGNLNMNGGQIYSNRANNHGSGIYTTGTGSVSNVIIRDHTNGDEIGIYVNGGNPTITGDQIYNNNVGIYVNNGNPTIIGNQIYNNYRGIYINGGSSSVNGNNIHDNADDGIRVVSGTNTFSGNTLTGNEDGFDIRGGTNTITSGNIINSNDANGIRVVGGTNTITGNTINSNSENGIYTDVGSITIVGNSIASNNRRGIYIDSGSPLIQNNVINSNVSDGIFVDTSGSPQIISNNIYGNGYDGIHVDYGSPQIHFNRIVDNTAYGLHVELSQDVDATNNWWGTNSPYYVPPVIGIPPSHADIHTTGLAPNTTYGPWLVLKIRADPTTIYNTQQSTVTAYLTDNSNGQDTSTSGYFVPDGILADFNMLDPVLGSLSLLQSNTVNGEATTIFTANAVGTQLVDATVDHQITSGTYGYGPAQININAMANLVLTKEFRDSLTGGSIDHAQYGQTVYAIVQLHNNGPDNATNIIIHDVYNGLGYQGNYWVNYGSGWIPLDLTSPFNGADWTIPFLGNGTTIWLAIAGPVQATGNDAVNNTANETFQTEHHEGAWPSAFAAIDVASAADVAITKTFENNAHNLIDNANYLSTVVIHLNVTNNGPDAANGVQIYDTIPAEFVFNLGDITSDAPLGSWTSAFDTGLLTITFNSAIANGTSYNFWIPGINYGHNNTNITNTAFINSTALQQYDPNLNDNNSTSWFIANAAAHADLEIFYADYDQFINNAYNIVQIGTATYRDYVMVIMTATNMGPDPIISSLVNRNYPTDLLSGLTWNGNYYRRAADGTWTSLYMLPGPAIWSPTLNGPVNRDETVMLALLAQVTSTGTITNTIETTQQTPADVVGFDSDTANLQVDPAADLSVSKDVDDNTPDIGQMIMYTIRAYNNLLSPNTATGVTVIDDLPNGVTFDHASSSDYDDDNDVWNVGTLLPGEMKTLYIWAIVNAHPTSPSYTNTAIISGVEYDWNLTNNSESETIEVPQADVEVTKTWENINGGIITRANYLETVVSHVIVNNIGPAAATMVVLTDEVPDGFQLDIANSRIFYHQYNENWSLNDCSHWIYDQATGTFTWNITSHLGGAMLSGWTNRAEVWLHFINTASNNALVPNTAEVDPATIPQYDPNWTNNEDYAEYTANAASDIAVTKTWEDTDGNSITSANYLETVVAHLTVTNNGPDGAYSVVLTDDLLDGFQLDEDNSRVFYHQYNEDWSLDGCSHWIYDQATGTFTWNISNHLGGAMLSGAANMAEVWLHFTNTAHNTTVPNSAEVDPQSLGQYDQDWSNNVAADEYTANPAADMAITKEFRTDYQNSTSTTDTANYHTPIWVMVHVTNAGPDAVEGLQVTDNLPDGLTYQNVYHVSHDGGLTWTALDTYTAGVWNIGTMPYNGDYWLAILAQVDGHNTTVTNVANKTQTTFDQNSTNNEGNATLNIPPAADVFVNTSISKNNPTVGEEVVVRVKVGNNGPDGAQNVIVTYQIPAGMEYVGINQEAGYPAPVYDPATRTVTWNLGNLGIIDPWMDITLRAVGVGATSSNARVTSDTYDPVPTNNVSALAMTVEAVKVNAATVPMQPTGMPIVGLILAVLMLTAGLVTSKRK